MSYPRSNMQHQLGPKYVGSGKRSCVEAHTHEKPSKQYTNSMGAYLKSCASNAGRFETGSCGFLSLRPVTLESVPTSFENDTTSYKHQVKVRTSRHDLGWSVVHNFLTVPLNQWDPMGSSFKKIQTLDASKWESHHGRSHSWPLQLAVNAPLPHSSAPCVSPCVLRGRPIGPTVSFRWGLGAPWRVGVSCGPWENRHVH